MLGHGGMGAVYEAQHVATGRPVAVKVLLPQLVLSSEAIERFRREARATGRLKHPNVVDVTDFGVSQVGDREVAYLVMELLEGLSLRAALDARGLLPLDVVVAIAEQIAAAVDTAHAAGIIHRDLKPDNVWLVNDGRGGFSVRVLDFGLARLGQQSEPGNVRVPATAFTSSDTPTTAITPASGEDDATSTLPQELGSNEVATMVSWQGASDEETTARLTHAGTIVGTPVYMSPEQCRGADVDSRTDVYSLGVLCYEALVGHRPFRGPLRDVMASHIHATPPPLPGVAPAVGAVVLRALSKAPEDRHASARALAGSLRVASEGPGLILRRSVALYAERLSEFLSLSWRVSRPVAIPILSLLAVCGVAMLFGPLRKPAAVGLVISAAFAPLLWTMVTVMTNATFAAAIERLRLRPLERLDPRELMNELRERLELPQGTGYFTTVWRLLIYYTRCELHSKLGAGDLAFLIGFIEKVPLESIPSRCATLNTVSRRSYDRVRAALLATLFAIPLVEAALMAMALRPIGEKSLPLAVVIAFALLPLNAIFVNPVFSSALVLLYFRARQANGEDVPLAAVLPARM